MTNLDKQHDLLEKGYVLFELNQSVATKRGFFGAVVQSALPLEPPISLECPNWDALSDSLGSGLLELERNCVVSWNGSRMMRDLNSAEFDVAFQVLSAVSCESKLAGYDVVIVGDWEFWAQ